MKRLLLAAGSTLLLAGCVTIPTSGAIQQGAQIDNDTPEQVIRVIARPPAVGMTPTEIVSGFIQASASFEDDHAVAREYLTAGASTAWNPGAQTVVYDGVPTLVPHGPATVDMTATQVGEIHLDGSYQVSPPGRVIGDSFGLAQVDGEWRISAAPAGLLLARSDVDRAYRSYNIYFLDPTSTMLVPDPRMVPVDGPGTATSLVTLLVDGPSEWLAPAVRTGFPAGTGLAVDAVPIVDGVARVDLDAAARLTDEPTRQAMSAQLTWTLRQVGGIRSLDLAAGGQQLAVAGAANPQPIDSWEALDPNAMPANTQAYAVVSHRVVELREGRPLPVSGGAGLATPPLDGIAISLDGTRVAGLDGKGSMWTGPMTASSALSEALKTPGQSRPSFGGGTSVWTIGPDDIVHQVHPNGSVVNVPVDGLSAKVRLESIAVSRDGTRAALVVRRGPRTFVMLAVVVLREGSPSLQTPVRAENRLTSVTDVVWGAADRLIVLGAEGAGAAQVYEIDLARSVLRALGAPNDPQRIAAAPGFPTLVSTADGQLYSSLGGPWRLQSRGSSPAYPGS